MKSKLVGCIGSAPHSGEKCMQSLDGKIEGKRPLGIPRRREENNIKINFI
jgi:hypothetical protein